MSDMKTEAIVKLGGTDVTIKKLKAGKFYQAQKIIGKIFQEAMKVSNGSVDASGMSNSDVAGMFDAVPEAVAEFVAVCMDKKVDELLEEAYPEEINAAFGVCLDLNDVMNNLKNSVAPMGKLGEKADQQA